MENVRDLQHRERELCKERRGRKPGVSLCAECLQQEALEFEFLHLVKILQPDCVEAIEPGRPGAALAQVPAAKQLHQMSERQAKVGAVCRVVDDSGKSCG